MIKEWIDKQKAKRKLLKFYRMCNKKRKYILYEAWDSEQYNKIEWLQYAIAYVLYKDFNCGDWDVEWDYNNHVSDKEMEELIRQLCNEELDLVKPLKGEVTDKQYDITTSCGEWNYGYITTLLKGNTYHDIENNKMYMFDGKNFVEMC